MFFVVEFSVPGQYYGIQVATRWSLQCELRDVRGAATTQTRSVLPAEGAFALYRVIVLP